MPEWNSNETEQSNCGTVSVQFAAVICLCFLLSTIKMSDARKTILCNSFSLLYVIVSSRHVLTTLQALCHR